MKLGIKQGQTALEYICLIGFAAAAFIVMIVYISRGFQGNVRNQGNQMGSGQYDPQNMVINNTETKHTVSTIISKSSSTTVAGEKDGSSPPSSTSGSTNNDDTLVTTTRVTDENLGSFKDDTW